MVLDTSVIFKWLLTDDELDIDLAKNILQDYVDKKVDIFVPDFLFIEIANILATKAYTTEKQIKESLDLLFSFNLNKYEIKQEDIIDAALLAKKYKEPVYDILFAVAAKNLKTTLVTADAKFVKATKFTHVKLLSE